MKRRVIGLTGGLGSGKSTVLGILKRRRIPVADADQIVRDLMQPGHAAYARAAKLFGREILKKDRRLDRRMIAQKIFSSPPLRKKWEKAVHPLVVRELRKKIASVKRGLVFLDIPLLFEAHHEYLCDEIWVVWAPLGVRLVRLKKAGRFSPADARRRIRSQMSLEAKCRRADRVIDNSGALASVRRQIKNLLEHPSQI